MSLKGFETETAPLTDYERDVLLPVMVEGLKKKVGAGNAVTNKQIVAGMKKSGYEITEVRVRKLINRITVEGLVPCLVASSKGYWVTDDPQEMKRYEDSLLGREKAIKMQRIHIALQRRELLKSTIQDTIIIRQ